MGCSGSTTKEPENICEKSKASDNIAVFPKVDDHARNAPESVGCSAESLIGYLSTVATEPVLLVRAFYVWITNHIWFDADGYFERSGTSSGDPESVLKTGKAVSEGYANLMEALCRQVDIPVKKITGYAKGFSYSAEDHITNRTSPNHAWNVVKINDKWYLVDCTWGAGHLDEFRQFKKEFDEFYFMTDPEQLITSHYPYMVDDESESSESWQLLNKPLTLEDFNTNLKYFPEAFKLGVKAVSHKVGLIEMEDEITVVFETTDADIVMSSTLWHKGGTTLYEKPRSIFDYMENNMYTVRIHPQRKGTFILRVFGEIYLDNSETEAPLTQLFQYVVKCNNVEDGDFEFPETLAQANVDKCRLLEPLQYKLPGDSSIAFRLNSTCLEEVMVIKTFLQKKGSTFEGNIITGSPGTLITVYGSRETYGNLPALYEFEVT